MSQDETSEDLDMWLAEKTQTSAEWKQTDPDSDNEDSVFAEVDIPCKLSVKMRTFTACQGAKITVEVSNVQIFFGSPDLCEFSDVRQR